MTITTLSSRAFNQDVSKAKHASSSGPVFITTRGKPSHVLLAIKDYRQMVGKQENITKLLAMPQAAHIDFKPPHLKKSLYRPEIL